MSYAPASGDEVALALAGAYTPPLGAWVALHIAPPCYRMPEGDSVALSLADSYAPPEGDAVHLALVCDEVPCYVAPQGDAIRLALFGPYTPPAGDAVALPLVCDGFIPQPEPEPEPEPEPDPGYIYQGLLHATRLPWRPTAAQQLQRTERMGWRARPARADTAPRTLWDQAGVLAVEAIRVTWQKVPQRDATPRVRWDDAPPLLVPAARVPWLRVPPRDRTSRVAWGQPIPVNGATVRAVWSYPPAVDVPQRITTDDATTVNGATVRAVWLDSLAKDSIDYRVPWGYSTAVRYSFGEPEPVPPQPPPQPAPCYTPPPGDQVRLSLRGAYTPPPADQVALHLTCDPTRVVPLRRTYIMSHSLSVFRVSDSLPIDLRGLSISIDEDTWAWSARLDVLGRASFHRLLPDDNGPREIEIQLDGHAWRFLVEDPSEDRGQPGSATRFSASARSPSALLAAPYAPEDSWTTDAPFTGAQIADRVLDNTGWTLDWQGPDWTVPAGGFSYSGLTPMGVITRVAEACGCMVRTNQSTKTIHVLPRYADLPWTWGDATPDVQVPVGAVTALAHRRLPGPRYHGVYVSGETQGVLVNVTRTGTAGAPYAEMIVDPLIHDTAPARERGGAVLADAQDRTEQPLTLPLTTGNPGPVLPGELVEVQDTVYGTYRARASNLQISCERRDEALVVRQTVGLVQHHDDVE